jgi:hypothetical protein
LQSVDEYLKKQGLTVTSEQNLHNNLIRALIEHKFWKEGFDRVIPGYRDFEFNEHLIKFIRDINLSDLSDDEK